jgi:hypothetical protein
MESGKVIQFCYFCHFSVSIVRHMLEKNMNPISVKTGWLCIVQSFIQYILMWPTFSYFSLPLHYLPFGVRRGVGSRNHYTNTVDILTVRRKSVLPVGSPYLPKTEQLIIAIYFPYHANRATRYFLRSIQTWYEKKR